MATAIIGTIVLGAFVFAGYYTYKQHKNGNCCSGSCSGCSGACKTNHKH